MQKPSHTDGLGSLRPVDDADAAALVSADTHEAVVRSVTAEPRDAATARLRSWNLGRRPLLLGVVLVAAVALVVLIPGLLSGNGSTTEPTAAQARILDRITAAMAQRPGTIVLQKFVTRTELRSHQKWTRTTISSESAIQTSPSGQQERTLVIATVGAEHEQAASYGNLQEIYDPKRNTIYETTESGLQAAQNRQLRAQAPKDSTVVSSTSSATFSYGDQFTPGRTSVFEQQLRAGLYKLDGRATIGGKPVLKLVPSHRAVVLMNPTNGSHILLGTVYLQPRTYYPIKNVVEIPQLTAGGKTLQSIGESVTDWLEYKVLAATPTNDRLVSLTAQHPTARVVNSATGYLEASQATDKH